MSAAGNDNTERPGYPAAYPEVIAVAATNASGEKASFSNYGDYIDVAAPGESIASTYPTASMPLYPARRWPVPMSLRWRVWYVH